LIEQLRQLARSHELLFMLVWRDIRIRYKQTIMGLFWAILTPSLIVGAGAIFRIALAEYSNSTATTDDIASVIVRSVPWAFFVSAVRFGTASLLGNQSLVTKLAFPKEVFPLAATISSLFDFAIAAAAVVGILLIMGWAPTIHAIWVIPLVLVLFALTAGLALILSAANLFFRDVKYLIDVFLAYAIFFTPVFYDIAMLGKWGGLVQLNPVAPILEALSDAVVRHRAPDVAWVMYSTAVASLILLAGYWFFKKLEHKFAESI
jgi:ABC-type polysaccharide/polyol phosphate export permease